MKSTAVQPLRRGEIQALAGTRQPLFLIGAGRRARLKVVQAIHREMTGKDFDPDNPHADLSVLAPPCRDDPAAPRSIGIEAVQLFVDRLCLTPCAAPVRIGFIEPASALTVESQNSLLRFVEEPTVTSRLILSSRRVEDMLPTLVSRCLTVRIAGKASDADEVSHLAETHGEDEAVVTRLLEILDDPDSAERLLEHKAAGQALEMYDTLARGGQPGGDGLRVFLEKKPATEFSLLFAETALAAAVQRLERGIRAQSEVGHEILRARRLLELQSELRYNPARALVVQTVLGWMANEPDAGSASHAEG